MSKKEIEILKQNGYLVRAEKIDNQYYQVRYPAFSILTTKSPAFIKKYEVHDDHVIIDNEKVVLAPYLHRLAIFADILCQCRYAYISPQLIFYYNEKGEELKNIFDLIDKDISKEDLKTEGILNKMLNGLDVPSEEQINVFKNFKILKGLSL